MSGDTAEIRTQRMMAWSRAKGELDSMLCTYWNNSEAFKEMEKQIKKFVDRVESNGLHE